MKKKWTSTQKARAVIPSETFKENVQWTLFMHLGKWKKENENTSGEDDIVETRSAVRERKSVTRSPILPGTTWWRKIKSTVSFWNSKSHNFTCVLAFVEIRESLNGKSVFDRYLWHTVSVTQLLYVESWSLLIQLFFNFGSREVILKVPESMFGHFLVVFDRYVWHGCSTWNVEVFGP